MAKILWLDDRRDPYGAYYSFAFGMTTYIEYYGQGFLGGGTEVVWVRNYEEFVAEITSNGLPDLICFDHDLGLGKTGMDAAKWLVDYCMDNKQKMPDFDSQSDNPWGRQNICNLLNNYRMRENFEE